MWNWKKKYNGHFSSTAYLRRKTNIINLIALQSQHFFYHLTLFQATNFGRFQTERVSRRLFPIRCKWQKVLIVGRKHCGKRRNWSFRAISPFPKMFSKDLYCKNVWERVKSLDMPEQRQFTNDSRLLSNSASLACISKYCNFRLVKLSTLSCHSQIFVPLFSVLPEKCRPP